MKRLPRKLPAHLKDSKLKKIVPMLVESPGSASDHKCGTCLFRVGTNQCAIVSGAISFKNGTCSFWAKGKPISEEVQEARMKKTTSGYVESKGKINCGTCVFFDRGLCKLWNGSVHSGDCCMAWQKS